MRLAHATRAMGNTAALRGRFEDTALLWLLTVTAAILSAVPLARLVLEAIRPAGTFSLGAIGDVLANGATWSATGHSLVVAFGGTALAVTLGGLVALAVTLTDIRARNAF